MFGKNLFRCRIVIGKEERPFLAVIPGRRKKPEKMDDAKNSGLGRSLWKTGAYGAQIREEKAEFLQEKIKSIAEYKKHLDKHKKQVECAQQSEFSLSLPKY
jgi:hypothetical protein